MCSAENRLGNSDAVFHTAAIWIWNADMQTGNYVPANETAPTKIAENRVCVTFFPHLLIYTLTNYSRSQDQPNYLCQFSYAVDTTRNKSLYDTQKVSHSAQLPGMV